MRHLERHRTSRIGWLRAVDWPDSSVSPGFERRRGASAPWLSCLDPDQAAAQKLLDQGRTLIDEASGAAQDLPALIADGSSPSGPTTSSPTGVTRSAISVHHGGSSCSSAATSSASPTSRAGRTALPGNSPFIAV